jgi:hypothetical protein
MKARSVMAALTAVVSATLLAACGTGARTPSLSKLPLVPGSKVALQLRTCNSGVSAYCAIELVVQDARFHSSRALVLAERDQLRAHGWTGASPDDGIQLADESPGHKLRITYATAVDDLQGIDLKWFTRPAQIETTLDRAVFDGVPTMSVLLEAGAQ